MVHGSSLGFNEDGAVSKVCTFSRVCSLDDFDIKISKFCQIHYVVVMIEQYLEVN
jgi:hypothetical protein